MGQVAKDIVALDAIDGAQKTAGRFVSSAGENLSTKDRIRARDTIFAMIAEDGIKAHFGKTAKPEDQSFILRGIVADLALIGFGKVFGPDMRKNIRENGEDK